MVKTRGLKELNKKIGSVEKIIDRMLKKKKKLRIFESGCGYGKVLMELTKKYGEKVEIVGMNLKKLHGDKKNMIDLALKKGVVGKNDLKSMKLPKIIYGDAGKKLPFKSKSIDLVYSQVSAQYYKDKLHFFEEVARILKKDGIARITKPFISGEQGITDEYREILQVFDEGKKVDIWKFVKKFKYIKVKKYVEIKSGKLDFKAKLVRSVNLNKINNKWFGVQSIYEMR
jgi:ubiquinone/menaquinone biosynthesis C-methylase UbiE